MASSAAEYKFESVLWRMIVYERNHTIALVLLPHLQYLSTPKDERKNIRIKDLHHSKKSKKVETIPCWAVSMIWDTIKHGHALFSSTVILTPAEKWLHSVCPWYMFLNCVRYYLMFHSIHRDIWFKYKELGFETHIHKNESFLCIMSRMSQSCYDFDNTMSHYRLLTS